VKKIILLFLFSWVINGFGAAQDSLQGLVPAGLPNVSYGNDQGFQYGFSLYLFQYGNGVIKPYKWNLILDCTWTTKQQQENFFFVDMPEIFGKNTRFDLCLDYQRYNYYDFYGVGNNNTFEKDFIEENNPGFINENYYYLQRRYFSVRSKAQFALGPAGLKGLAGLGFYNTRIEEHDGKTKLGQDLPHGITGGATNYLQLGIVYDRRDEEAMPNRGCWSEVLLEAVAPFLGSDYTYTRITTTDRRYISLHPRIVYAQRLLFETMPGDPPFYEMGIISSSLHRRPGLGGSYSLRGVPRFLFIGPTKFVANFELRLRTLHVNILKQDFTLYIHPFIDCGKVWLRGDPGNMKNLHLTQGLGFHVRWNKDFVGALDFGHSQYEPLAVYMSFGNMF